MSLGLLKRKNGHGEAEAKSEAVSGPEVSMIVASMPTPTPTPTPTTTPTPTATPKPTPTPSIGPSNDTVPTDAVATPAPTATPAPVRTVTLTPTPTLIAQHPPPPRPRHPPPPVPNPAPAKHTPSPPAPSYLVPTATPLSGGMLSGSPTPAIETGGRPGHIQPGTPFPTASPGQTRSPSLVQDLGSSVAGGIVFFCILLVVLYKCCCEGKARHPDDVKDSTIEMGSIDFAGLRPLPDAQIFGRSNSLEDDPERQPLSNWNERWSDNDGSDWDQMEDDRDSSFLSPPLSLDGERARGSDVDLTAGSSSPGSRTISLGAGQTWSPADGCQHRNVVSSSADRPKVRASLNQTPVTEPAPPLDWDEDW
mmetsp:Transcript_39628/g.112386  ORF Transcript_39628/g.112386 Transcript_39628/m.112386 type:complete len:364 (+) Transcript_39628:131-1222(+)|eukprot:CAMPEP_0117647998 /NCGR_PEP_ID=MMETSP0804-20121206/150_1 /TAXON_ID=1074897 /ORGANISM="Tetraselmis astigmatica, Strain CCMP880" /LENGTH=363 /DNA_ID=CAMNT_0005453531 /DNA_START=114 /DNA_END=1205 /DNA_ORIENTATION=-